MTSLRSGDVWLRALSALALLALWQAAATAAASPQLPGPTAVLTKLVMLTADGRLPIDLGITLLRVTASFALSMAAGAAIGILMGHRRRVDAIFDLWLVIGLNIPALVIIYLCYLWGGLTEMAAILAVALNKVPNTAVIRQFLYAAGLISSSAGENRTAEICFPPLVLGLILGNTFTRRIQWPARQNRFQKGSIPSPRI